MKDKDIDEIAEDLNRWSDGNEYRGYVLVFLDEKSIAGIRGIGNDDNLASAIAGFMKRNQEFRDIIEAASALSKQESSNEVIVVPLTQLPQDINDN